MSLRESLAPPPAAAGTLASLACLLPSAVSAALPATLPSVSSEGPGDLAAPASAGVSDVFTQAFFLNVGFSFLVGLAAGYALKIAFRIALLVIGVILLGVFGLQYAGLVDVNWSGVEVHYDSFAQWLQIQGSAFLGFIGHNLSSGASFLAGLAIGLKL